MDNRKAKRLADLNRYLWIFDLHHAKSHAGLGFIPQGYTPELVEAWQAERDELAFPSVSVFTCDREP